MQSLLHEFIKMFLVELAILQELRIG